MAGLNKLHMQVWGEHRNYEPNTYIQGIASHTPDAATLASKLEIPVWSIKNYQVNGDDVSCHIRVNYTLGGFSTYSSGRSNGDFWIDKGNKCKSTGARSVSGQNQRLLLPSVRSAGYQSTRNGSVDFMYLPSAVDGLSFSFYNWRDGVNRLYIPRLTVLWMDAFKNFRLNGTDTKKNTIYVHPSLMDYEGNGIHPRLQYVIDRGGLIRYVQNFHPPNSITDLDVSIIVSNTAQIDFTPPTGANAIDFYEVWIEEVGNPKPETTFLPKRQELTASGQMITGLKPSSHYKIKLATCDIFWNGTGMSDTPAFSNEVTFTTGSIAVVNDLSVGLVGSLSVQLLFTPVQGAAAYNIYVNGIQKNTITDSGQYLAVLEPGTVYTITIKVVSGGYEGADSNSVTTTTTELVPLNGLVSYYKLEGDAIDAFGGNNGTVHRAATAIGKVGNGLSFDGVDDYVELSNMIGGNSAFTIGMWFKNLGKTTENTLYGYWGSSKRILIRINSGQIQFYTFTTSQAGGGFFEFSDTNNFHLLIVKYDGVKMTAKLNNVISPIEFPQTGLISSINNRNEEIGRDRNNYGNAIIDELFIYDRATLDTEDTDLYNNGNGTTL